MFLYRQRLIQEEKARVEKEQIAAKEKAKQDVAEQALRVVQLQETVAVFKQFSKQMYKMKLEKRAFEEVCMTTF
jgi:prophage tail gpP-like protein